MEWEVIKMFIVRLLVIVPLLLSFIVGVTIALVLWVCVGKQLHSIDLPLEDLINWLMELGER